MEASECRPQRYDIGSKWLLQHQGKAVLEVGGVTGVRRCEAMPGEIVQSRRYPDGLLRVFLGNDPKPHHALIEFATYAEKRAVRQALDDLTLAYSALGHLPELLMFVLRPKGTFRIPGTHTIQSKLGHSELAVKWRTIELWTLSAERFLAAADIGVVPWIPLMQFDGPPEPVLQRCAERIEQETHSREQADLLTATQVLTELRFPGPDLMTIFGGPKPMIESPMLKKMIAENCHEMILEVLRERFEAVPRDLTKRLREILDEKRLKRLVRVAARCADLDAFRDALLT